MRKAALVSEVYNNLWSHFPPINTVVCPHVVLNTSCVSLPRYKSDLYSESWLGQTNADGSETRPAGNRRTKSSPEHCLLSPDWGFRALHHILDVHLLFQFHNKPHQDFRVYKTKKNLRISGSASLLAFFYSPCCVFEKD